MIVKTKSLENIERKMEDVEKGSIRHQVLKSARNFKTSWVELGQSLYAVWKDKLYRDWDYSTFDAYTSKEIGIKKPTAMKLLKSYFFLEKEEPHYLQDAPGEVASLPSCESVNVLRLAKNKPTLDADDYRNLKRKVFEEGREATQVKRDLTTLIRQREELDPEEAREKRKVAMVRRSLSVLKTLKKDLEVSRLVSAGIIKDITKLIDKIETEIS